MTKAFKCNKCKEFNTETGHEVNIIMGGGRETNWHLCWGCLIELEEWMGETV